VCLWGGVQSSYSTAVTVGFRAESRTVPVAIALLTVSGDVRPRVPPNGWLDGAADFQGFIGIALPSVVLDNCR
jgi:hypothetical protein